MPAQKPSNINLLPQKGMESSVTGRVLAWILSSFRIIVIVTEMIVMVAFLSRFWLDAQNSDLSDDIEQKTAVLQASSSFEKMFSETQKKLVVLKTLDSTVKPSEMIKGVSNSLPSDIVLESITFSEKSTKVSGLSSNELSVAQYAANLGNNKFFLSVTISELSSDDKNPGLIKFSIELTHVG